MSPRRIIYASFASVITCAAVIAWSALSTAQPLVNTALIKALKNGGVFASNHYLACIQNLRYQGLSWAFIAKACETDLSRAGEFGFKPGLIPTEREPFNPKAVQDACRSGADPTRAAGPKMECLSGRWGCFTYGDDKGTVNDAYHGLSYEDAKAEKEAAAEIADGIGKELEKVTVELKEAGDNLEQAGAQLEGANTPQEKEAANKAVDDARARLNEVRERATKLEKDYLKASEAAAKDPNSRGPLVGREGPDGGTCVAVMEEARQLLAECHRTGWKDIRCQQLQASVNRCPDPTQILVDPSEGYTCGSPKVSLETFNTVFRQLCERRVKPGPDSDPCAPPKPIEGSTIVEPGGTAEDVCNDPYAYVDPEGAGCFTTIRVGGPKEIGDRTNIDEILAWGQGKLGGPIVLLPLPKPKPPRPGGGDPRPPIGGAPGG